MRDYQKIARECLEEVKDCGIQPGNIAAFVTNGRLSHAWGRCVFRRSTNINTIELQPFLLEDATPLEVLKATLIHEILHTCEGCHNHGAIWESYTHRINARYGYKVTQYATQEEISACMEAGTFSPEARFRYIIDCARCGQRICRSKMSAFVRDPGRYVCSCGSAQWVRIK